jgi:ketosteroid isomerase-like protein
MEIRRAKSTMDTANEEIVQALRAIDDQFEHDVRAKNARSLVENFYAEEAQVLPQDHPGLSGKRPITDFWQGMFDSGLRNAFLEITQVGVSGDLAYEVGKYTLVIGPAGSRETQTYGKYLVVHERQPGGTWRAIVDMFGE